MDAYVLRRILQNKMQKLLSKTEKWKSPLNGRMPKSIHYTSKLIGLRLSTVVEYLSQCLGRAFELEVGT